MKEMQSGGRNLVFDVPFSFLNKLQLRSCFKYLAKTQGTRLSVAHGAVGPDISPDAEATTEII